MQTAGKNTGKAVMAGRCGLIIAVMLLVALKGFCQEGIASFRTATMPSEGAMAGEYAIMQNMNNGTAHNALGITCFGLGAPGKYAYRNAANAVIKLRRAGGVTDADTKLSEVGEDVFSNIQNANAAERIDYIIADGYTIVARGDEGFVVMDKGRKGMNEGFCVAVITDVDGTEKPTGYSKVLRIAASQYGPAHNINGQDVAGVFVRFSDLGLANGAVIYGYSIMAADFAGMEGGRAVVDWNNKTNYPATTDAVSGGLDLVAVTGIFQRSELLAPLACNIKMEVTSTTNSANTYSVPALKALDLNPGGGVADYKVLSIPPAAHGILYYNTGMAYRPVSQGQTISGQQAASLKFQAAPGYMGEAIFQYTATNNSGLVSNVGSGTIQVYLQPTTNAGQTVNTLKEGPHY